MQKFFPVLFPHHSAAIALQPSTITEVEGVLSQLGFHSPRPAIVVVGGARELRNYHIARLHTLFAKVLVPLAEAIGAVVIDGGTDTGVMRMMGVARQRAKATFPLIGVLPEGVARLPNALPACADAALLEPNHTHFILIPGSNWGDDSPWIAEIASLVSQGLPSITILINGGEITWQDASESVRVGRPVVAIAGSGRAADVLANALNGDILDHRAVAIVESNLLQAIRLEDSDRLTEVMKEVLLEKAGVR